MMKKVSFVIYLMFFLFALPQFSGAQTQVEREPLFKVPLPSESNVLGVRVSANKAFVVNSAGRFIRYDLDTKELLKGKAQADRIIDFDIVLGQLVFLDGNGRIGGRVRPSWPDQSYSACKIDASSEGLLLSGGDQAVFLEKTATAPVFLSGLSMILPIQNGFVWAVQKRSKTGNWGADLYDSLGNLMHEVYTFSNAFEPAGLELGPVGLEGELMISAYENNIRKLSLIAHNGYMFWKMDGPPKLFMRDLAFDHNGHLLVLEQKDDEIWLTRWKLTHPEG